MNYNLVSLVDFIGLVQGLFLGVVILHGYKKNNASLWLGLFIMAFSFELLNTIIVDLNLIAQYPFLRFLPINFFYLTAPLFYLYVKLVTSTRLSKEQYAVLIPGILEFILFSALFIIALVADPALYKRPLLGKLVDIYEVAAYLFSIYFALRTLVYLRKYRNTAENFYSNLQGRQLIWASGVMLFIILQEVWLMLFHYSGINFDQNIYLFLSTVNVVFIFWVGISGLRQSSFMTNPYADKKNFADLDTSEIAYGSISEQKPHLHDYILLKKIMEEKELYKEHDLTLADLSIESNIPQRKVSQLIKERTNKNFNQFVNHYRIEEAKKILTDIAYDNLNMFGVACESGFSSKATFYLVFKKFTKTTPNLYRKRKGYP